MNPKLPLRAITLVMALIISLGMFSQEDSSFEPSKRIVISNITAEMAKTLVENGVDLRCGANHSHDFSAGVDVLQLELLPYELKTLDRLGVSYMVLIDDLESYNEEIAIRDLPIAKAHLKRMKALQAANPKTSTNAATQDSFLQYNEPHEETWDIPTNFNLGAGFGGCLTVDEVMSELDDMNTLYPGLVSARLDASPSGETTYGNNSPGTANDWAGYTVNYVRMTSDQGSAEGSKPAMLFTSMIHSREVSSLMSNIYFMWYLLENYGTDSRITELLDNNEIYFIPVVNPDGLRWNEEIRPNGGGLQRKNLRPGAGSSTVDPNNRSRGVDLNRNFDYYWGINNSGSSGSSGSDSYRGPSAFSEPEARILRDFMLWDGTPGWTYVRNATPNPVRDFKIVLMNHTTSNVIPHPYGGVPADVSGRENEFHTWHMDMTKYNRFVFGATIFPEANGIADDWMLGATSDDPASPNYDDANGSRGSRLKVLGTTPEIGGIGFWPGPTNILPEAQSVVRQYMISIYYGGKYAKFHDLTQSDITSLNPTLTFGIERVGQTASDFDLVVTPGTNMTGGPVTLSANGLGISGSAAWINVSTAVTLDSGIQPNDKFTYTISLQNDDGNTIYEIEMEKVYQPTILFSDNPDTDGLTNWTEAGNGGWNNSSLDGFTGTRSIRSSTTIPYANNASGTLTSDAFDISGAGETIIQYYTKYDIERNFDYVEVLGSTNGTDWFPVIGTYNKAEATAATNGHNLKSGADESFQSGSAGRVYDGDTFDEWVMEEIVIDPTRNSHLFGSNSLQIRFRYASDSNNRGENYSYNYDGFFLDDFKVIQTSTAIEECSLDVVSTFPHEENFDAGLGVFRQFLGDDGDWTINNAGTPSGDTGPNEGNGPSGFEGGQYLYTEASNGALGANATATLESGCLDLTDWYDASAEFDYHMYGSNMGSLRFEVSTDDGLTWVQLFLRENQQQGSSDAAWTTQVVDLSAYDGEVIRVRFRGRTGGGFRSDMAIDNFVLNATQICSVPTTWNGSSWDNGVPTPNLQAVIAGNYNMNTQPSIDACSITVQSGATLTVAAGTYVHVENDVTVDSGANLVIEHEGSVVQVEDNSNAVNNGSITASKTTPTLGFREFSIMSSPLSASTRDVAFAGAFRAFGHNPANFDTNDAVSAMVGDAINFVDQTGNDRIPLTSNESLDVATGYLVVPFGPGPGGTFTAVYSQGNLNNGVINKGLTYNGSPAESANLIGNPYASAINAFDFLTANAHIPELYFWNQNTAPATGPGYLAFSMEDISQFNSSGGIAAASDPGNIPNEFVASGQGFGVKPTSNADAVFNNSMRVKTNNNNFKSGAEASTKVPNRIWLQMNNALYRESTSTTLVAFLGEATDGLDVGYDSKRIGTYVSLFSTVDGQELGIQGRSAFDEEAVIPMGFKTLLEETTAYTISIAQLEGNELNDVQVYLKDLQTGIIVNLSERDYTFTESQGHYPERFELSFKSSSLGVDDLGFSDSSILLYPNPASSSFTIQNTSNEPIKTIKVLDIQGRIVLNKNVSGQSELDIFVGQLPSGVYMVKLQTNNAEVIKRLIKN